MYGLVNTIINRSLIPVYCAYSAPAENGEDYDIWKVSLLSGLALSDSTDIDYIKPVNPASSLCWGGSNGGVVRPSWKSNNWVKVRQWVTTEILSTPSEPMLGYLKMGFTLPGVPTKALDEARKYDGGFSERKKGTKKTQEAMNEWDAMIRGGQISFMKTRKLEFAQQRDSPDENFDAPGTYDVKVASRWHYEYVLNPNYTVTWRDKFNGQQGNGHWEYNSSGTIRFKWNGSNTKEVWYTKRKTGTCQYEGKPESPVEWSKR
jgi:hypothetical protein